MPIPIQKVTNSRRLSVDFNHLPFGKIFSDHMLMAEYKDGKWHEPQILPYGPILYAPSMAAIHYAQSIFEGLKAYYHTDGRISIFRPDENYVRMNRSAERMSMPMIPQDLFMNGLLELVKLDQEWVPKDEGSSLYIRPVFFATDEIIGVKPSENYQFIILTSPTQAYYSKPLRVRIETTYSRASRSGTGYAKAAGNYGGALYPTSLAQKDGFDQVLWSDAATNTMIEESGTMNVMFVIKGKLITPILTVSKLAGITRDSIIRLAKHWGIEVEERHVMIEEIIAGLKDGSVTEAFGTGTAANVAEIRTIALGEEEWSLKAADQFSLQNRLASTLMDVKYGREDDIFGWNKTVI
jgi:branched-chain amino acid aminotransferase